MWVADEDGNAIHAVKNTNPPGPGPYTVFPNILSHVNAEGVYVIPNSPCTFTPLGCSQGNGDGAFFLAEQQMFQQVWKYPLSDFTGLGGKVILTSEAGIAGRRHFSRNRRWECLCSNFLRPPSPRRKRGLLFR